ncbi:hypothetical protein FSST1_010333 [Fusarium sambucinum]
MDNTKDSSESSSEASRSSKFRDEPSPSLPWPIRREYALPRHRHDLHSELEDKRINFVRRYERRPVIVLSELRQRQSLDAEHPSPVVGPTIIWNLKVYQSKGRARGDNIYLHEPDLTYVDDRPINLSVGDGPIEPPLDMKKDVADPTDWTGPVIIIEQFIEADIQEHEPSETGIPPHFDVSSPKHVYNQHLVVKSPFLVKGLSHIVQYYPSFHESILDGSEEKPLSIQEPFAVLFHHYDAIEAMANGTTAGNICKNEDGGNNQHADRLKLHMKDLLEFLRPIHMERNLLYQQHICKSIPQVSCDMIWYLLKPGTDVYIQSERSTHAAVVVTVKPYSSLSPNVRGTRNKRSWLVDMWLLVTDGSRLRRASMSAIVYAYPGLRDVTSLPVCPISDWDVKDGGERRRHILRRSAIFFKALRRGNLLVDYNGPIRGTSQHYKGKMVIDYRRGVAVSEYSNDDFPAVQDFSDRFQTYDEILVNTDRSSYPNRDTREGPVIVEPADSNKAVVEGHRFTRKWLDSIDVHAAKDTEAFNTDAFNTETHGPVVDQLTEHQLLLLYPNAPAYALRHKAWIQISFDYVHESVQSDESISNLIIAQDELKTIQALSNRQNTKTEHWAADFIEGKGSGQIILLHGPPGVGKTYTVEAISEWLHRPLLALTVADIGTVETLVEGELMKWFGLAEAWNAVLLVDEADIFLERRQNRDLARNGLVSAFLRRMEYFKGLLFLTTNRVGQIDDAFISRVHVAIGYEALDGVTRQKVWSGFFRKLVRERAGKIQIAPDAKKWVLDTAGETSLNGRDIRNALQTAITLAEFECQEDPDYDASLVTVVTKAHFQKVLEMCNRFRSYVTSIRREDEKKRAQGRGDRNDYTSTPSVMME